MKRVTLTLIYMPKELMIADIFTNKPLLSGGNKVYELAARDRLLNWNYIHTDCGDDMLYVCIIYFSRIFVIIIMYTVYTL